MSDSQGVLYVVATPIGNLEDITYRAVRILSEVDIIAAEDTRAAARLLGHYQIRSPQVVSFFAGNEAARTAALLRNLATGRAVAIISEAGTPAVSDPGERLVQAAIAADIRVEVIPGPVAAITALVGSGLPARRFLFLGFPPRAPGARQQLFGTLRREAATMLVYESPERIAATCTDMCAAFGPERPAALARELTKRYEEVVRAPLGDLAERYRNAPPRGECVLVVQGATQDSHTTDSDDLKDIEAQMRHLLATGLSAKDAAARLVVTTGKPRRQLYQLALSIKRRGP